MAMRPPLIEMAATFVAGVALLFSLRCATGNEHKARGEDAYYCRKVRDAHPVEFAELRAEWSERLN